MCKSWRAALDPAAGCPLQYLELWVRSQRYASQAEWVRRVGPAVHCLELSGATRDYEGRQLPKVVPSPRDLRQALEAPQPQVGRGRAPAG